MLITSRTVRGRCPVCGVPNCTCGGPSNVVPVDERVTPAVAAGELVKVEIRPGLYRKVRRVADNKMVEHSKNKSRG